MKRTFPLLCKVNNNKMQAFIHFNELLVKLSARFGVKENDGRKNVPLSDVNVKFQHKNSVDEYSE
jgi:hypothetical protein